MSFVADAAAATGLAPDLTERAAGTLLAAVKMSTRKEVFAAVEAALPETAALIGAARPAARARTGEMLSFVTELADERGATRLAGQLEGLGLSRPQIAGLVGALLDRLRRGGGDAAAQALTAALPGLTHLLR